MDQSGVFQTLVPSKDERKNDLPSKKEALHFSGRARGCLRLGPLRIPRADLNKSCEFFWTWNHRISRLKKIRVLQLAGNPRVDSCFSQGKTQFLKGFQKTGIFESFIFEGIKQMPIFWIVNLE